jgi:hypothetical protein
VPVTVNINGLSCIHQTSGGVATATLPDVCRTPYAATPIPYPNVAMSTDLAGGTLTVAVDGSSAAIQSSMYAKSTGDEAGALGGVVSQVFMMEATFLSFSPTVFFEGQPVCRLTDKMLMNKANTVCMFGSENQPVSTPDSVPPGTITDLHPGEPTFCKVQLLQVGCKHERPPVDLIGTPTQVVQVTSTKDDPDEISVTLAGTCGYGNPNCPTVMVAKLPAGRWEYLAPGAKLKVPPPEKFGLRSLAGLIEWLGGTGDFPLDRYLLRPLICNGHDDPTVAIGVFTAVEVIPPAKVEGEISLTYAHPNITKPKKPAEDGKIPYDRTATWSISGSLSGEIAGWKLPKLERSADMAGSDPLPVFGRLIDLVGKTNVVFDSMKRFGTRVQGDILPSVWTFSSGGLSIAELPSSHLVGPKGSFGAKLDPLIGARLTVSILDYLILFAGSLCPGAGTGLAKGLLFIKDKLKSKDGITRTSGAAGGLSKEREKAAEGEFFAVDIDIELVVDGKLTGGFEIEILDRKGTLSGEVSNEVTIKIEAKILGKVSARVGRYWRAEFAGGGKVGIASAKGKPGSNPCSIKATWTIKQEKKGFVQDGTVEFSGMAAYYLLYAEGGVAGLESEKKGSSEEVEITRPKADDEKPGKEADKKEAPKPKMHELYKKEGIAVLMEPWTWVYSKRDTTKPDPSPGPDGVAQGGHGASGISPEHARSGGGGAGGAGGV